MYGVGAVMLAGLIFLAFRKPSTPTPEITPAPPKGTVRDIVLDGLGYENEGEFGTTQTIPSYQATPESIPPVPSVATAILPIPF